MINYFLKVEQRFGFVCAYITPPIFVWNYYTMKKKMNETFKKIKKINKILNKFTMLEIKKIVNLVFIL